MMQRIAELAAQLSAGALASDDFGDDSEHAATALQALTMIFAAREARAAVARWERVQQGSGTVLRLRPDNPPTPAEAAALDRNMAEMIAARKAPAADIFDGERYAHLPGGAPGSRREMNAIMKEKHLVPISDYDSRNGTHLGKTPDMSEIVRAEVAKAITHIHATGNVQKDGTVTTPFVPPPVTPKAPAPPREPTTHAEEVDANVPPPFIDIPKEQRRSVDTSDIVSKIGNYVQRNAIADAVARGAM